MRVRIYGEFLSQARSMYMCVSYSWYYADDEKVGNRGKKVSNSECSTVRAFPGNSFLPSYHLSFTA